MKRLLLIVVESFVVSAAGLVFPGIVGVVLALLFALDNKQDFLVVAPGFVLPIGIAILLALFAFWRRLISWRSLFAWAIPLIILCQEANVIFRSHGSSDRVVHTLFLRCTTGDCSLTQFIVTSPLVFAVTYSGTVAMIRLIHGSWPLSKQLAPAPPHTLSG